MKRVVGICFFTDTGRAVASKISEKYISVYRKDESLQDFVADCFSRRLPVIFIGATGIAVRTIAPFIKDKLSDSPVIVVDCAGKYVIPILSGHVGRANEIAVEIAGFINAEPVITTATDTEDKFSVDVFAVNNNLRIKNREGIALVSSKLLRDEKITMSVMPFKIAGKDYVDMGSIPECVELVDYPCDNYVDVVVSSGTDNMNCSLSLVYKEYVLGIGCKKGKTIQEIMDFLSAVRNVFDFNKNEKNIMALTSIDLKADEPGLIELAQYLNAPFVTYSAEELGKLVGDFSESQFVKDTVGVGCVCERAAKCFVKDSGDIVQKKISDNGITLCTARIKYENN